MTTNNKDIEKYNEYETFLAYLNEAEDQQLTDEMLSSKQGCKQLEGLQKDMQTIENNINEYRLDENYGSDLWNKISTQLDDSPKRTWLQKLFQQLQQSRFSAVGLVAMFMVATTFYLLGQNQGTVNSGAINSSNQQLLAQNMQLHLAQADMFLTQVSNMSLQQNSPVLVNAAQSLLASNRIYKSAYVNNDNKRLQSLLTELEQVLMEITNGNTQYSQKYIQDYASDELLFKVKSTNQQLKSQLMAQTTAATSI